MNTHPLRKQIFFSTITFLVLLIVLFGLTSQPASTTSLTIADPVLLEDINLKAGASNPSELTVVNNELFFQAEDRTGDIELWKTDGSQSTLVKNISDNYSSEPRNLTELDGILYFSAFDSISGRELWRSDGTEGGTTLVKDINPSFSSNPAHLTVLTDTLIFVANTGTGLGLWRSDGTELGTQMIGVDVSGPNNFTLSNGLVFFSAYAPTSTELWKTDGTITGTEQLTNMPYQTYINSFVDVNGTLFFRVRDHTNNQHSLWKSDGTVAGTEPVKVFTEEEITEGSLTAVNNQLFFVAENELNGSELWVSDGTELGTIMVKDIYDGSSGSYPEELTNINGRLYFSARDYTHGREVWISDGTETGTKLLRDIAEGSAQSLPENFVAFDNQVIFSAVNNDGRELWQTDGTLTGTVQLKDIHTGTGSSSPIEFTLLADELYFSAEDTLAGRKLWVTDGTENGTHIVSDPVNLQTNSSNPHSPTSLNNQVFFIAESATGPELWANDPNQEVTEKVVELGQVPPVLGTPQSQLPQMQPLNDTLYLPAYDETHGIELWQSDGTEQGTSLLTDINPSSNEGSLPRDFVVHEEELFFTAYNSDVGRELWATDGINTRLVKDINTNWLDSDPLNLLSSPVGLFFIAETTATGYEPWISDGTEEGTFLLKDIWDGPDSSVYFGNGKQPVVMGNAIYFPAEPYDFGDQLWRTDGTTTGTYPLKTFGTAYIVDLAVMDDTLFFTVQVLGEGSQLWKSDGTTTGTTKVLDIEGAYYGTLTTAENKLYFLSFNSLWVSDGTESGTYVISGVGARSGVHHRRVFHFGNGIIFFSGNTDTYGEEVWQSDGTEEGTFMVMDINPGSASSHPHTFYKEGNSLYFVADDGVHGEELWQWQNGVPIAVSDEITTEMNISATIDPLNNDSDPDGNRLTVFDVTAPIHGQASVSDTHIIYTPTLYYVGVDSFQYTIEDTYGATSTATISVTITGNAIPEANDDEVTTEINTPVTFNPLVNDVDLNQDPLSIVAVTDPLHGTFSFDDTNVIYTPTMDYVGLDTFQYTIQDTQGATSTATISVTITENMPPQASDDEVTTEMNTRVTFSPLVNDIDPNQNPLNIVEVASPSYGEATFDDTNVTYTPTANYLGVDMFNYMIQDSHGATSTATITVTITGNALPLANDDAATTWMNTAVSINPLDNDTDPNQDVLTITETTMPSYGTINLIGDTVVYTPTVGYVGSDSFIYTVDDGRGGIATATINVTVQAYTIYLPMIQRSDSE